MTTCPHDFSLFQVSKIRQAFPMLAKTMNGKPLVYLDTAATAQKPETVIQTITQFYTKEYGTVHRAVYELAVHSTEMYAQVRSKVQHFIQAREADEIIFTRGTTESINLVANSFSKAFCKKGDEIIISEMEHHSNIVPWQLISEQYGIILKIIPINDRGELDLEVFKTLLSKKTKLVSIAHVANSTGTINPIEEIIYQAHQVGAKVFVDGAQAAPHLMVNVQDLDVDFYAFSGHKLYGPTGIGVLYGKKNLLEALPPFLTGGDMIEEVTLEKTSFQKPPLKFEAGTPSIAEVIGLGAAIDYIEMIGLSLIQEWEQKLLRNAQEKLTDIQGIHFYGTSEKKAGIISFTIDGIHPLDLGTILALKGIAIRTGHLCAQPTLKRFGITSLARISFGMYNTYKEIDILLHALKEAVILLKSGISG